MFVNIKEAQGPRRYPGRIPVILQYIEETWKKFPDLRLMQLLLNLDAGYYTEDDELMDKFHELYGQKE
jgi:uncharacterized protein YihD (DUF1040 family)